jgi:CheY-like chemotaxis protein
MPVRGGLDVLRCVRGQAELKDIPVVLYYGSNFMQDQGIFQKLGVAACIEKKLGCDELTQTVGELLRHQQPLWRSTLMVGAATRTFPGSNIARAQF